jgi:hypothetical protein
LFSDQTASEAMAATLHAKLGSKNLRELEAANPPTIRDIV